MLNVIPDSIGNLKKMKSPHQYYVYILGSKKDGVLYIGVTNDLETRLLYHKRKTNPNSFTSRYRVFKLLYYEKFENINDAILREKKLKKWKRVWKINLFEAENPNWEDLSKDWGLDS